MEAEATSAVIAAQALVPLQACSSPGQGSTSVDDGHLHCGCRWSPNDTSSTMVDIDSLVASMYQSNTSAWQPELDNFYNYSCEVRPNCNSKDATLRNEATRQQQTTCSRLQSASSRINSHRMISPSRHSPLCIKSFRANSSSATRDASDESKQTTLERNNSQPTSLRRTYGLPEPIYPAGRSNVGATGRDIGSLLVDPDRQRRDSGVLVEDQDTTGSGNSMLALNIPAIELTSLTRQLDYSSLDRRSAVVRQH